MSNKEFQKQLDYNQAERDKAYKRIVELEAERDRLQADLTLAKEVLEKIARGQNKERSTGMDTPPIAVSRDQLRMWAQSALEAFQREGEKL